MMFDGVFHWTSDAEAEPPPAASANDDRRRRWIGAAILFLMVLG